MFVPSFKILRQVVIEKLLTENFENILLERKKMTNKGTDYPYVAGSLIHRMTCHT